jgi:8-oxo-dGTP diphosphatase
MAKIKASIIICDKLGNILLQLRDEEPEKGKWVLFGGSVEKGETELQAIKREIKEELEYEITDLTFFKKYELGDIKQPIFISKEHLELNDLTLHEGEEMRFFSPQEIPNLAIGFNYKGIILDYLEGKAEKESK